MSAGLAQFNELALFAIIGAHHGRLFQDGRSSDTMSHHSVTQPAKLSQRDLGRLTAIKRDRNWTLEGHDEGPSDAYRRHKHA